jgi:hypothetical protein
MFMVMGNNGPEKMPVGTVRQMVAAGLRQLAESGEVPPVAFLMELLAIAMEARKAAAESGKPESTPEVAPESGPVANDELQSERVARRLRPFMN